MANQAQTKRKLKKAFDEFLSLFDESFRDKIKNGSYVAGGAISSVVMNEEPNDYDIFFKSKDILDMVVAQVNATPKILELVVFKSDNAITLSNKYQLIKKVFGDPKEITAGFDFAHNACYYDPGTDTLGMHELAFESMASKNLFYITSKFPFASLIRTKKFIKRGWNITAGQMLKICLELQDVDLHDPVVLKEQLKGIDLSYISEFLDGLGTLSFIGFNKNMVIDIIEKSESYGDGTEEKKEEKPPTDDKTY
jgi:hypothetical protein